MSGEVIRGRQVILVLTNKTGGAIVEGDVVILSSATASAFITTTSSGQKDDIVGVALEDIANDAGGRIIIQGYCPKVNLSASASLGDYIKCHSVAKQAVPSGTLSDGAFGQVLETGTTPKAILWGKPHSGGGGDVSTDAIWDAKGDLVVGTGANTADILSAGDDEQVLVADSGEATGLKWVTPVSITNNIQQVSLFKTVLSGSGTFTFDNIPGTYDHLIIRGQLRSANNDEYWVMWRMNDDATNANYTSVGMYYGSGSGSVAGTSSPYAGYSAAANSPSGQFSQILFELLNYSDTAKHKWVTERSVSIRSSNQYGDLSAMCWKSTSAITKIVISNTAGANFSAGSWLEVIGVKTQDGIGLGSEIAVDDIWAAKGDLAVGSGANSADKLSVGTNGMALVADSAATNGVKWGSQPYICIQDQKSQNTSGGTFTSGDWRTRDLNTEVADTYSLAAISSNQIVLEAGTYIIHASAPAHMSGRHQARLYNVTDAAVILWGTTHYGGTTGAWSDERSMIIGQFTIASQKTLSIQHKCTNTNATYGFGVEANFGTEVYTIVELWRVG